ncbi:alpha/beta hydrolase fold domain-containing protein [Nocardioides sp. zg-579]|uniref:Alpha/beta hydrolase fold domain-containing protein n=1 Tax=Nocardioides marmotae TaxID=2663857 RepID=A0A6I3JG92_9ACTN|nr:alpha/beta hydrolase [Nocardioides marmotae]MCR6033424.1 alpha/beta hydrolase fold domain-containing protein [Gordonia jinghuaiqii]MTB97082.1 alpha/beta hydrolase fold domain-containing protein [Nocardioides marmotae]QKE00739.1 alpha/beta hydrolase [Nocardioides marmotae]
MLFPESRRALEQPAGPPVWSAEHDLAAERAAARAAALAEPREEVAEVRDVDADGVPCRLYRPAGARPGVVVHLHGGGFVFHDVEVHDPAARRLANRTGLSVLSVDYRRPPEEPFPAAPDDVSTALRWLQANEPGPYVVHGDSAGANLALVAALRHPGVLAAAVLIYPFLDPSAGFDSYRTAGDGFDPREAAWYWQQYAATPADLEHPDLAPLRAESLAAMPSTLVVTAEHDPLRDEGEHLTLRLAEEGVQVVSTRYQGQIHGFWRHPSVFPAAEALMGQVAGFVRQHVP